MYKSGGVYPSSSEIAWRFCQLAAQRSYSLSSQTLSFIKDHKKKILAAVILMGMAYLVYQNYQSALDSQKELQGKLFKELEQEISAKEILLNPAEAEEFSSPEVQEFSKWVSECAPTCEVSEKKTYVDVLLEKTTCKALEKCTPKRFPLETSLPFSERIQLALEGSYSLLKTKQGKTQSDYVANELGQKVAVLKQEAFFEKFIRKVVGPKYQYLFPQIAPIQIANQKYTAVEFIENASHIPMTYFAFAASSFEKIVSKLYQQCPNFLRDRQIIALTDYFLGNGDRHPGNILFTKHCQMVGIDHDDLFYFEGIRVSWDLSEKVLNSTITPLALAFLQSLNVTQLRTHFVKWLELPQKMFFSLDNRIGGWFLQNNLASDLPENHTVWKKSGVEILIGNVVGKIQRATQLALNGASLREIIRDMAWHVD